MRDLSPLEVHAIFDWASPENLRGMRHSGLLEGIGHTVHQGQRPTWRYEAADLLTLAMARFLNISGRFDLEVAFSLAKIAHPPVISWLVEGTALDDEFWENFRYEKPFILAAPYQGERGVHFPLGDYQKKITSVPGFGGAVQYIIDCKSLAAEIDPRVVRLFLESLRPDGIEMGE